MEAGVPWGSSTGSEMAIVREGGRDLKTMAKGKEIGSILVGVIVGGFRYLEKLLCKCERWLR